MLQSLSLEERQRVFGPLDYQVHPVPGNPENIIIKGDWVKQNIVVVALPAIGGKEGTFNVQFHRKAADALQFLFAEWKQAGLLSLVLSWGGTFCPRLVRGGKTLSNHAFGTAFDINMKWNPLGQEPVALGEKGSVRELVAIAEKHGFFWGGNYKHRKDGMHFEYSRPGV